MAMKVNQFFNAFMERTSH